MAAAGGAEYYRQTIYILSKIRSSIMSMIVVGGRTHRSIDLDERYRSGSRGRGGGKGRAMIEL